MVTKYNVHPFAKLFPLIDGLVDEIAAELHKTRRPPTITLFEGKILDGPLVRDYTGKNPRAFVVRSNITRRHLTIEERANLDAELATGKRGATGANCQMTV